MLRPGYTSPMRLIVSRILVLTVVTLGPGLNLGWAATLHAQETSETSPSPERIRQLVEQLSAGNFAERQAALRDLLQTGLPAAEQLRQASSSGSPEVRERAVALLSQIFRREFDQRLKALKAAPMTEYAELFPEWKRFSKIAGTEADAIQLFIEILQSEAALFTLHSFAPERLPEALEQRSSELALMFDGRADEEFPAASAAALFLLGCHSDVRLLRATSTNISTAMADDRLSKLLRDGARRDALSRLLSAWIERPGIAAERPLLFAMEHQLSGGRVLARRIIASRSRRPDMLVAILSLGVLGNDSDVPLLEELFSVETVLWPAGEPALRQRLPNGESRTSNYSVQTRDAALVVAAHLRRIAPEQLGLNVRPSEITLFAVDTLGFETPESRMMVFAEYHKLVSNRPQD